MMMCDYDSLSVTIDLAGSDDKCLITAAQRTAPPPLLQSPPLNLEQTASQRHAHLLQELAESKQLVTEIQQNNELAKRRQSQKEDVEQLFPPSPYEGEQSGELCPNQSAVSTDQPHKAEKAASQIQDSLNAIHDKAEHRTERLSRIEQAAETMRKQSKSVSKLAADQLKQQRETEDCVLS